MAFFLSQLLYPADSNWFAIQFGGALSAVLRRFCGTFVRVVRGSSGLNSFSWRMSMSLFCAHER
jgi:hypothetical protein